MSKIILYDLPSKGRCTCWSYNPWKARLALNFKDIDYQTTWLEYPDVKSTLKDHVKPTPEGLYTIPKCKFPDGTYIRDSRKIVERLEKNHPSPSLHLDSPLLKEVENIIYNKVSTPLRPIWMPQVPTNLLNDPSREYFQRTREEKVGKPLAQVLKENDTEETWMAALPGLKELGKIIDANGGPYIMGKTSSYADFMIVSWLHFQKRIDERLYEKVVKIEPALAKLYDASRQWLERDDH